MVLTCGIPVVLTCGIPVVTSVWYCPVVLSQNTTDLWYSCGTDLWYSCGIPVVLTCGIPVVLTCGTPVVTSVWYFPVVMSQNTAGCPVVISCGTSCGTSCGNYHRVPQEFFVREGWLDGPFMIELYLLYEHIFSYGWLS